MAIALCPYPSFHLLRSSCWTPVTAPETETEWEERGMDRVEQLVGKDTEVETASMMTSTKSITQSERHRSAAKYSHTHDRTTDGSTLTTRCHQSLSISADGKVSRRQKTNVLYLRSLLSM